MTRAALCLAIVACGAVAGVTQAQEDVLGRNRQEGLERSQVYALFSTLTDQIGPRLAGTPAYKQSSDWTRDHLSFSAAGVPGFNPIQEYKDYDVRTHHTNVDLYERVRDQDLKQNAIVMAWFAWQAANTAERIARP